MRQKENGAPGTNRTCDPWLRRPILYPLSYGRVELDKNTGFPRGRPVFCVDHPAARALPGLILIKMGKGALLYKRASTRYAGRDAPVPFWHGGMLVSAPGVCFVLHGDE